MKVFCFHDIMLLNYSLYIGLNTLLTTSSENSEFFKITEKFRELTVRITCFCEMNFHDTDCSLPTWHQPMLLCRRNVASVVIDRLITVSPSQLILLGLKNSKHWLTLGENEYINILTKVLPFHLISMMVVSLLWLL